MNFRTTLLFAVAFIAVASAGTVLRTPTAPVNACGIAETTDLIAGESTDVGDITVYNDGSTLHIQFATSDSWRLHDTYVHVAPSLAGIPVAAGSPQTARFEFQHSNAQAVTGDVYEISMKQWPAGTVLSIAAGADAAKLGASSAQAAWGDGMMFGSQDGRFFTYTIQACSSTR
jgi:hypothetical protein